jgi:outer membrane beta-barrel protein
MRVRSTRSDLLALLVLAATFGAGHAARAEDTIYGPDGAPTIVQRKLHTMTGRWEAGLAGGVALNTSLVDQYSLLFSLSYHPNEWLDLGADLLGDYAQLSGLSYAIRADLRPRAKGTLKDEFANAGQLRGGAFAMARLAPIYGKFNLASEVSIHFQAYLLGGGGVGYLHHESVNLCATAGTSQCTNFQTSDAVKPMAEFGGGFRFYLGERWSVRTEVRSLLFADAYREQNDVTIPSSGSDRSYLGLIVLLDAGVSVIF